MFNKNIFLLTFAIIAGCGKVSKQDYASTYPTSNVETIENNGVVTGKFKKDASGNQILLASNISNNKENYIQLAPGSLSLDTDITLQDGSTNVSDSSLKSELGLNSSVAFGSLGSPISVNGGNTETLNPFVLSIAPPFTIAPKTALLASESKVGMIYLVKTSSGQAKIGLYMIDTNDLVGTLLKFKSTKFGWFSLVIFTEKVTTVEEKDSTLTVP